MPTPRLAIVIRARQIQRYKEARRLHAKTLRERDRVGRLVRWVRSMHALPEAEREWRIRLLTGPDDRSITGRQFGDPRYLRSALYAKRMGAMA